MAVLNLRNVPETVHRNLRLRAAGNGRSMESEARAILDAACGAPACPDRPVDVQAWVGRLYGARRPRGVTDALIAERRREAARE
jgi:plasmid stability protein